MYNEFNSYIRPIDIDTPDYIDKHIKTIEWHAQLRKQTTQEILELWRQAPSIDIVWNNYTNWLLQFHSDPKKPNNYTAPIRAGYNIINFDDIIVNRLVQQFKTKYLYSQVYKMDVIDLLFYWFEGFQEIEKMNMDYIRDYFGIPKTNAHDALQDVKDIGSVLIRFLRLHRNLVNSGKIKFKGAFNENKV